MDVIYYNQEVKDFIAALEYNSRSKTVRSLELLKDYGYRLSTPHSRMIGSGVYELRIHGEQEVRLFYTFYHKKAVILLGYRKKTQAIPASVLDLVRKRLRSLTRI